MVAFRYYETLREAMDGGKPELRSIPFEQTSARVTQKNEIYYYVCGTEYWCGEPDYQSAGNIERTIPFLTREKAEAAFEAMALWEKSHGILDLTQYQTQPTDANFEKVESTLKSLEEGE